MSVRTVTKDIPSFDVLTWATIKALKAMDGSASNEELLEKVIELEGIPESVASLQHSGHRQTRLAYRLAWAKSYLKIVGALNNSERGVWSLTEKGSGFSEADCQQVRAQARHQRAKARKEQATQASENDELEPESVDAWKDTLLATIRKLPPAAFERLSQRILRESGFIKVTVTGRSGDGGIDGVGVLRVKLLSFQVLFQCKRYQGSVGPHEVRDFRGAMVGRCDKGLLITTGTYSAGARAEATRDGAPAIDLIDGDSLCDLLKQLKLGVQVETVESVTVEQDWFESV